MWAPSPGPWHDTAQKLYWFSVLFQQPMLPCLPCMLVGIQHTFSMSKLKTHFCYLDFLSLTGVLNISSTVQILVDIEIKCLSLCPGLSWVDAKSVMEARWSGSSNSDNLNPLCDDVTSLSEIANKMVKLKLMQCNLHLSEDIKTRLSKCPFPFHVTFVNCDTYSQMGHNCLFYSIDMFVQKINEIDCFPLHLFW